MILIWRALIRRIIMAMASKSMNQTYPKHFKIIFVLK